MRGKTHLTGMNAKTTLSAKGQVVIPKDVRDALGLKPGQVLDVVRTGNGVLLTVPHQKSGRSAEEIFARIREIAPKWEGPPVSIEDMDRAVDAMFAARGKDDI
ncbi:MAG: AbrB/MazE/SpoVT family DNA-binding domain-containing protein [Pseudomonadota bacterium]